MKGNDDTNPRIRELNLIHKKLDSLDKKMSNIPDKFEDKMDEKIDLHKARCRASDMVKYDDNGNAERMTVFERIKDKPEDITIPTFVAIIVIIIIKLSELGLI